MTTEQPPQPSRCAYCMRKLPFILRKDARFCSRSCKVMASRARKAERATPQAAVPHAGIGQQRDAVRQEAVS